MKENGAKRALKLPVGGAFHSPLMQPAAEKLEKAILSTEFKRPICPIYQNVSAKGENNETIIKQQLLQQLTSPVRWTQTIKQMIADGTTEFYEFGPGDVLKGLVSKINKDIIVR
jgi:[acyl-carrier-protein] S-malonyltransferase